MRVGFDAKRLFLNNTGLGNYSRTLIRNLVKYYPDNTYYLYSPTVERNAATEFFFNQDNIKIITPEVGGGAMWRSRGILKDIERDEIDVFHGLSNELPLGIGSRQVKSVVTIHDVIFEKYPEQYPFLDRTMYRAKTKNCVKQADRIISISNQTTEDLLQYYKVDKNKISLLYQTCSQAFTDEPINLTPKTNDYFLYVGSVIVRKNLLSILKAMVKIKAEDRKKLIVVGTGDYYYKKVRSFAKATLLEDWIEWKGMMGNVELKELYKNSIALIYPSIYEGFGIPVIESMFAGRPVITSNLSSLKEAGGDAAVLINPFEIEELIAAMEKIVQLDFQKELKPKVEKHLEKFAPQSLSEQLMALYRSLS